MKFSSCWLIIFILSIGCWTMHMSNMTQFFDKVFFSACPYSRPAYMAKMVVFLKRSSHPDCVSQKTNFDTEVVLVGSTSSKLLVLDELIINMQPSGRGSKVKQELRIPFLKLFPKILDLSSTFGHCTLCCMKHTAVLIKSCVRPVKERRASGAAELNSRRTSGTRGKWTDLAARQR